MPGHQYSDFGFEVLPIITVPVCEKWLSFWQLLTFLVILNVIRVLLCGHCNISVSK